MFFYCILEACCSPANLPPTHSRKDRLKCECSPWQTDSQRWRWFQTRSPQSESHMGWSWTRLPSPWPRHLPEWRSGYAPVRWNSRKELVRRILFGVILNCNAFHETLYHVQLSFLLRHAGDGHRGENRGSESQVGVDGCPVLSVAVVSDGWVKAGPEHPQEQRAWGERDCQSASRTDKFLMKSKRSSEVLGHLPIMANTSEW